MHKVQPAREGMTSFKELCLSYALYKGSQPGINISLKLFITDFQEDKLKIDSGAYRDSLSKPCQFH